MGGRAIAAAGGSGGALRFVAIGDSLTEGKGDVHPDGTPRGFADLLAASLRQVHPRAVYANLARPSVRAAEVLGDQVPHAVDSRPDLVTAVAGVNDVIALRFPAAAVAVRLDEIIGGLRAGAPDATIVTATLPDLGHLSWVAARWRSRLERLNAATVAAAARHGALVVDLWNAAPLTREELALDRVHPSPLGHLRIARAFARTLDLPAPAPAYLSTAPRLAQLQRVYRTAVVAPRFVAKRMARRALIAGQPPKRPDLAEI